MPYYPFAEPGCPATMPGENGYSHSICVLDNITVEDTFDYGLADYIIAAMRLAVRQNRTFMLMAGFRRPHLPWRLPKSFWDMYADRPVAAPAHPAAYAGMPEVAYTCGDRCSWETWNVTDPEAPPTAQFNISSPVPGPMASQLRRAYYAALTLMDSQVGRVLEELAALGRYNNTVVVFHGDHGWGLGEGNLWHKMTNFEHTVRVPLLVRVPWRPPAGRGHRQASCRAR